MICLEKMEGEPNLKREKRLQIVLHILYVFFMYRKH